MDVSPQVTDGIPGGYVSSSEPVGVPSSAQPGVPLSVPTTGKTTLSTPPRPELFGKDEVAGISGTPSISSQGPPLSPATDMDRKLGSSDRPLAGKAPLSRERAINLGAGSLATSTLRSQKSLSTPLTVTVPRLTSKRGRNDDSEAEIIEEHEEPSVFQPYASKSKVRIINPHEAEYLKMEQTLYAAEGMEEQTRLELHNVRAELAQANRNSEEARNELKNVEACVDGWKSKYSSLQAERDQLVEKLETSHARPNLGIPSTQPIEDLKVAESQNTRVELAQVKRNFEETRNELRNVEACVNSWKSKYSSLQAERDQLAAKLETSYAHPNPGIPSTQPIEDLERMSVKVQNLEGIIESLEGELDTATDELSKHGRDHRLALLARNMEHDAKIAELKEFHDQEKVCLQVALDAAVQGGKNKDQDIDGLNARIKIIEEDLRRGRQELEKRNMDFGQTLLDAEAKHHEEEAIRKAHQAVLEEAESLKARVESLVHQCDLKARALLKQGEDHKKTLLNMDQINNAKMTELKEVYDKEKADFQAARDTSVLDAAVEEQAMKELKARIVSVQGELSQAREELEKRDVDTKETLLNTDEKHASEIAALRKSHNQEKEKISEDHRAVHEEVDSLRSRVETLVRECDVKARALSKKDQDHKQVLLVRGQRYDAQIDELRETHKKAMHDAHAAREHSQLHALDVRCREIREEEQQKYKKISDDAIAKYTEQIDSKHEAIRLKMQRLIDESSKQLSVEEQRCQRLELDILILQDELKTFRSHPQGSTASQQPTQPKNAGDVDMEPPTSEKAFGKQPDFVRGGKGQANQQAARQFLRRNSRLRNLDSSNQDHAAETIQPPMRFSRPYGADTPLADQLHMPNPPLRPRNRSHTPIHTARRPSLYDFIQRSPTPFRTGSPGLSSREPSPAIPLFSTSGFTASRASSPIAPPNFRGPSSSEKNSQRAADPATSSSHNPPESSASGSMPASIPTPGGETSNAHPSVSGQSIPNPSMQGESSTSHTATNDPTSFSGAFSTFVSEIRSEFKSIRGEIQHTQKLITPQSTKTKVQKHGAFTTKTPPRPRTTVRTEMMASARAEMNILLGIKCDNDVRNITEHNMASPDDVAEFLNGAGEAPPLDPLRPYWDHIQSPWNHHLADAFAIDFMKDFSEDIPTDQESVSGYFLQRLETLKKHIVKRLPKYTDESPEEISTRVSAEDNDALTARRRGGRVQRRFAARLEICTAGANNGTNLPWQILFTLVDMLGRDGHSSDESSGETHVIRLKEWRSTAVTNLLKYVDRNRKKISASGKRVSGVNPYVRIRNRHGPLSSRQAVAGLPRNFYDDAWYDSLSQIQQRQLGALEAMELPEFRENHDED